MHSKVKLVKNRDVPQESELAMTLSQLVLLVREVELPLRGLKRQVKGKQDQMILGERDLRGARLDHLVVASSSSRLILAG